MHKANAVDTGKNNRADNRIEKLRIVHNYN